MTAKTATPPSPFVAPGRRVSVSVRVSRLLSTLTFAALAVGVSGLAGCEDKAIGRVCELTADGGENQAVVNPQALECPTRICLRPARDNTVAATVDTTSLCSAECSKDSDCDGAETRNTGNSRDRRCKSGFVCGVASVTGTFCCKKLCMCKDFLVIPSSGLETPAVCDRGKNPGACPLVQ
jgi:hypothetical protein